MKPLRLRLSEATKVAHVPQHITEVDYSLGHILASIYRAPDLREGLVFKGGTALRKAYFHDYRFSLDLDFTAIAGTPSGWNLESALRKVIAQTDEALQEYGPFSLSIQRHLEKQTHPGGQEAFDVHIQFPWHPMPLCNIKLEITYDEPIVSRPLSLPLIHRYEESLDAILYCYSLEEIMAEKLRSLRQAQKKIEERGWGVRERDYYDLWQILRRRGQSLNLEILPAILQEKCQARGVEFIKIEDGFAPLLLSAVEQSWQRGLSEVVADPPPFPQVISELRILLQDVML